MPRFIRRRVALLIATVTVSTSAASSAHAEACQSYFAVAGGYLVEGAESGYLLAGMRFGCSGKRYGYRGTLLFGLDGELGDLAIASGGAEIWRPTRSALRFAAAIDLGVEGHKGEEAEVFVDPEVGQGTGHLFVEPSAQLQLRTDKLTFELGLGVHIPFDGEFHTIAPVLVTGVRLAF